MSIKHCIFDLDGTLFDTLPDICTAVNETIINFGYPEITLDECRNFVGSGTRYLLSCALKKEISDFEFETVFSEYMINYRKNLLIKTKPYSGIETFIKKLKENGILISVCTNKPDDCSKKLVEHFFDKDTFFMICGQTENIPVKPDPYFTNIIIEKSKIKKDDTVFIGDSAQDVLTGKNADIKPLSVLWGYQSKEKIISAGGDTFFTDVSSLENYILNGK